MSLPLAPTDLCNIAIDLVSTTIPFGRQVKTHSKVRSLAFSTDGNYLAIGESNGRVTIRDMSGTGSRPTYGKRLVTFNTGKGVPVTSIVWFQREGTSSVFIGAGNGLVNCVTFVSDDFYGNHPRNTAVQVSGLITNLALNTDGSQIAVSYDYTTKIFPLPFPEGEPTQYDAGNGFLINQDTARARVPVREHPRALSLCYLDKFTLCVAFFSKIQAYTTDPASRIKDKLWEIRLPQDTSIGSLSVSPCGELAAARSLTSGGVEWFSLSAKQRLSTTKIEDDYDSTNVILPIQFLTDKSFVTGSNQGRIVTGTNGVDRVQSHEAAHGVPSQYLAVSRTTECIKVAFSSGTKVRSRVYTLPPAPTPQPAGPPVGRLDNAAHSSLSQNTAFPPSGADPTNQRKVSFGRPEFIKAATTKDGFPAIPAEYDEDEGDDDEDNHALDSSELDGFHTAAQTPANPRSKTSAFPLHGSKLLVPEKTEFFTSTPTRGRSRSPPPFFPNSRKLPQPKFEDEESNSRDDEDSIELARTNTEGLANITGRLWLDGEQQDRNEDDDEINSSLEYVDYYEPGGLPPPNTPPQPIAPIHSPAPLHDELDNAEGNAENAAGGRGDEDPPQPPTNEVHFDIHTITEAARGYFERLFAFCRMNKKLTALVVLSLLACAFAFLLGRPSATMSGAEIAVPVANSNPTQVGEASLAQVGSLDEGGDPGEEDDLDGNYKEGGEAGGCDTVVLTDTKVITITRTITNTVTSTVTAAPRSTRRGQKARRRKGL